MQQNSTYARPLKQWLSAVAALTMFVVAAPSIAQQDQQALVQSAQSTFSDFQRDPDMPAMRVASERNSSTSVTGRCWR